MVTHVSIQLLSSASLTVCLTSQVNYRKEERGERRTVRTSVGKITAKIEVRITSLGSDKSSPLHQQRTNSNLLNEYGVGYAFLEGGKDQTIIRQETRAFASHDKRIRQHNITCPAVHHGTSNAGWNLDSGPILSLSSSFSSSAELG